jgi:hypothetical protein
MMFFQSTFRMLIKGQALHQIIYLYYFCHLSLIVSLEYVFMYTTVALNRKQNYYFLFEHHCFIELEAT